MMHRIAAWGFLIAVSTLLGIVSIYMSGYRMYTLWFLGLVASSGIVAIITRRTWSGMGAALLVWSLALLIYEGKLGLLRSRWNMPFEWKSLIEGLVLIMCFGLPVSWLTAWLSIKNRTCYVGAAILSTIGISVLSKTLLSMYAQGAFGHWI